MEKELKKYLSELDAEGDQLIKVGKVLLEKFGMTEFTVFCIAILNRTINLNRGYISLLNEENYIAAAPLVRINLDSLLRLFASSQSEFDYERFAYEVRNGKKIADIYDSNKKKKLHDSELVKRLKNIKGFSWVKDMYGIGSGFIHFSHQHVYSAMKIKGQKINGGIRKNDEFIPVKEKVAGAYFMIQCSKGIRVFIGDWIDLVKKSYRPTNKFSGRKKPRC
ncbi:MAG: hypothetical protein U9O50_05375 [Acidobacteriota bacterium]|nr:hypothetical protein [Acidobacteriota bacterium]